MSVSKKTSKLCRICLNTDVNKYMSLFEKYKEFTINDYILLLTNVEIKKGDGFPDKICSTCFVELETAVNFKQKCEDSDVLLKASKDKIKKDAKDRDTVILKKEEPYEVQIKFEEAIDDSTVDDYYAVDTLEDLSTVDIKPYRKSRSIDLKLECHDCGSLFKSKCKLRVHWKKAHLLPSLICETCKRRFKSYKAYHIHKTNKFKSCDTAGSSLVRVEGEGKSRQFHCKECKYKTFRIKDIQSHIVIHSGDKPYPCNLCPNRYTQQSSLQAHMEAAHKKFLVEITCQYCGKLLRGRTTVYRHLKTHTEAKRPCTICQKLLSKKSFKSHMQRHSGVKSYTCEKCASTFYTLGELCNHRRWVHNRKNDAYKCSLCSYTASRQDRIKNHQKNHAENNIPCTICGMFFPNTQKLETHQKRHFEEKKHECPYCKLKFFRRDSVNKHIKSKHKNVLLVTKERVTPVDCKEEEIEPTEEVKNLDNPKEN